MLAMEVNIISERGGRSYNEDACGHWQSDERLCCVLADGAGGHGGGDVAARLAVKELLHAFVGNPTSAGAQLEEMVRDVNRVLLDARAPGPTQNMHTTLVCLVVDAVAHHAHWVHAGDSRLYWFRNGGIRQRTRDHSLVQSLVDAGLWKMDDLKQHPKGNELVSALGMATEDLEIGVSDEPARVEPGDVFLLCSDGCWEYLDDDALLQSLAAADTPRAWLADLTVRINAAPSGSKSHDNFTAMAVWVSATPGPTAAPAAPLHEGD